MKKRLISFMLLITVISCFGFNTDYFKNLLTLISQAAKEVIYEETETTDSAVDSLEQELEKLDVRNFFEDESETESGRITIPSLQQMHDAVTQWARMEESLANSNRQLDKFNTATVVYDARTGNSYYGMNRGVQLSGDTLNLSLESWLPESSLNQYRLILKTMYQNRCAKIVYIHLVIELQMCYLINWEEEVNGRIKKYIN